MDMEQEAQRRLSMMDDREKARLWLVSVIGAVVSEVLDDDRSVEAAVDDQCPIDLRNIAQACLVLAGPKDDDEDGEDEDEDDDERTGTASGVR